MKKAFGYNEKALYQHFLKYGLKEGRNMSPILNVVEYRAAYKDLDAAFGDDWDAYVEHFLTYGAKENREEGVLFNPIAYEEAYGDIKEAFGGDLLAVVNHYKTHGIEEKRAEGTSGNYASIAEKKEAERAAEAAKAANDSTPDSGESQGGDVSQYPVFTDPATGKPYDLGGREFFYYTWFPINPEASAYGEAQTAYRKWAEETYNFKMSVNPTGDWGGNFQSLGDLAAGDLSSVDNQYRAYLVPGGVSDVMAAIKDGLVWDLTSLGVIDFTEPRYAVNGVADAYSINGHAYGMSADIPEPRNGIWFNKGLLEKTTGMTADDLYDLQKSNQWTWAKFEEICQKIYEGGDTDNDGVKDVYAIAGETGELLDCAVISNNTEMFPMKDGKFEYNMESPAVVEAIEWSLKVARADYWYRQPEGKEWDYFISAFDKEGKCVFMPGEAYNIHEDLSATTENVGEYGFLMFPIGPNANGQFINGYSDNVVVIPKCYNEEEAKSIAIAYNIWTAAIPGFEDYNTYLGAYSIHTSDNRLLNETIERMTTEGGFIKSPEVPNMEPVAYSIGWFAPPEDEWKLEWWYNDFADQWKALVEEANQ